MQVDMAASRGQPAPVQCYGAEAALRCVRDLRRQACCQGGVEPLEIDQRCGLFQFEAGRGDRKGFTIEQRALFAAGREHFVAHRVIDEAE